MDLRTASLTLTILTTQAFETTYLEKKITVPFKKLQFGSRTIEMIYQKFTS